MRSAYTILVGKHEGKSPLGRPTNKWQADIRIEIIEIGWELWSGLIWLGIRTSVGLL
jgi:hypothetical protein